MPPPEPSAKLGLLIPTAITAAAKIRTIRFMSAPVVSGGKQYRLCDKLLLNVS